MSAVVQSRRTQTLGIPLPEERASSRPAPRPGSARYALQEEVGRGGMGRVVRARDQELLRDVALKLVHRDTPDAVDRLLTEARVTGQLDHPNVLPVYDLGQDEEGAPFFTMKLVSGHMSLLQLADGLAAGDAELHAQFSFQRRVRLIQEVCHALNYAHERGVLHRDLKLENILVGPFGEVYLVDWGLAMGQAEGDVELGDADLRAVEIQEDSLVGTPAYMAPELFDGADPSPRTEVYALGVVLYELLTLRHPLGPPETIRQLVHAARYTVPAFADTHVNPIAGRVPRALAKVCARALEKDPQRRFASAHELERALQRWLEGRGEVFCAGTCVQRGLHAWSRWIDQHTYAGPLLSLIGLGLVVGVLVREVVRLL